VRIQREEQEEDKPVVVAVLKNVTKTVTLKSVGFLRSDCGKERRSVLRGKEEKERNEKNKKKIINGKQ
jgi:hypothetical protein